MRHNTFTIPAGTVMDITESKKQGAALKEYILESVKATQTPIMRPLPCRILMTNEQFIELDDDIESFGARKGRFYVTPYNVMEVEIVA